MLQKFALALFLLVLILPAQAERYVAGPYTVEFQVDFPVDVDVKEPISTDTLSGIPYVLHESILGSTDNFALIRIGEFSSTIDDSRIINATNRANRLDRPIRTERTIDGHLANLAMGDLADESLYLADWRPDDKTAVSLVSNYPWDQLNQLLSTINITRAFT